MSQEIEKIEYKAGERVYFLDTWPHQVRLITVDSAYDFEALTDTKEVIKVRAWEISKDNLSETFIKYLLIKQQEKIDILSREVKDLKKKRGFFSKLFS